MELSRYKCNEKSDGIAILTSNGVEEGSDERDIPYRCNEKGEYDMPTKQGKWDFPKCIPRRKYIPNFFLKYN